MNDWDHVRRQMQACDDDLQAPLKQSPAAEKENGEPKSPPEPQAGKRVRKKTSRNQPGFGLAAELKRVTGVDLTRIDGVQAMTVRTVIGEAGLDMSRRPSEAHFVSWLGLAPANDISGGKVLKKGSHSNIE